MSSQERIFSPLLYQLSYLAGYAAEELSGLQDEVGVAVCHGLGEFLA